MPNLRPFRDYDEHDVVNLFTLTDNSTDLTADNSKVNKGTLVQINDDDEPNGWLNTDESVADLGNAGTAVGGTVSLRYGVTAKVKPCESGSVPLGITLYDMAERDENGEKLLYNPRKAEEMNIPAFEYYNPIYNENVTSGLFSKGKLIEENFQDIMIISYQKMTIHSKTVVVDDNNKMGVVTIILTRLCNNSWHKGERL